MQNYNNLFNYLEMGNVLKETLAQSYPDFQKLSAFIDFQQKQQQINAMVDEKNRQAVIAQQQLAQTQADRYNSQVQARAYADAKINSLRALQQFNNQQADLNIAFGMNNYTNLKQSANSELLAGQRQGLSDQGKVRTSFGGSAIMAETGTALDMTNAAFDANEARGYNNYLQRFNQAQAQLTEVAKQNMSKSYSQFDTEQQIYFTNLMVR